MRTIFSLIFIFVISSSAVGQWASPLDNQCPPLLSARLRAMGQVGIAVPDLPTEVFINPAMLTLNKPTYVFAGPLFTRYRQEESQQIPSVPSNPSSFYYHDNSTEMTYGGFTGGYGWLGPIAVGGCIAHTISTTDMDGDQFSYESSPGYSFEGYYRRTEKQTTPNTLGTLQIALPLGPLAIGIGGTLSGGKGKTSSIGSGYDITTFSPDSPERDDMSSDNENRQTINDRSLNAGALLELENGIQASLTATFTGNSVEDAEIRDIEDGNPIDAATPTIDNFRATGSEYCGTIRYRLTESIMIGSRITYALSNSENKSRRLYNQGSVYDERLNGKTDNTFFQAGIGGAVQTSPTTLFAVELLLGRLTVDDKAYATDTITFSATTFAPGDLIGVSTSKFDLRILRIGGEIGLMERITGRMGVEYVWRTMNDEQRSDNLSYTVTTNGILHGDLYPSAGFKIDLTNVFIEYALRTFEPAISGPGDFSFTHLVNVTVGL